MKTLISVTLAIGALVGPALSFAQTAPGELSRAEVRADLAQLEHAGYNPAANSDATYPDNVLAAEAKVAAQQRAARSNDAVGGVAQAGSSQAGAPVAALAATSDYEKH